MSRPASLVADEMHKNRRNIPIALAHYVTTQSFVVGMQMWGYDRIVWHPSEKEEEEEARPPLNVLQDIWKKNLKIFSTYCAVCTVE